MWAGSISVWLLAVFAIDKTLGITQCTKRDMCSCTTEDGKVIDLKPLSQDPPLQVSADQNVYMWNPCDNFQYKGITAGCLLVEGSGVYDVVGVNKDLTTQNSVDLNGNAIFTMSQETIPAYREASVTCACPSGEAGDVSLTYTGDSTGTLTVVSSFTLTAPHCCPGYSPPPGGTAESTLSIGSVMCIIFFSVLVLYLALGFAYQTGVRKSQGAERIPHVAFWATLPGLVKDGFTFTFSRNRNSRTEYNKI